MNDEALLEYLFNCIARAYPDKNSAGVRFLFRSGRKGNVLFSGDYGKTWHGSLKECLQYEYLRDKIVLAEPE